LGKVVSFPVKEPFKGTASEPQFLAKRGKERQDCSISLKKSDNKDYNILILRMRWFFR